MSVASKIKEIEELLSNVKLEKEAVDRITILTTRAKSKKKADKKINESVLDSVIKRLKLICFQKK